MMEVRPRCTAALRMMSSVLWTNWFEDQKVNFQIELEFHLVLNYAMDA